MVVLINQGPSHSQLGILPDAFNLNLNLARTCGLKEDVRQLILYY